MKAKMIIALITIPALIFTQGCQKSPGPGGKAHIHGHVEHHDDHGGSATEEHVSGAIVYIWYGASSVSNTASGYDDNTNTNAEGEFEFEELNKGDYFLFASWTDDDAEVNTAGASVTIVKKSEEVEVHLEVE